MQGLPALLDNRSTIGFSHCGTAVAIIHAGRQWPQLFPLSTVLPEKPRLQGNAQKRPIDDRDDVSRPTKRLQLLPLKHSESNMDRNVAAALNKIPSVLSSSSVVALQGQGHEPSGDLTLISSKSHPNQIDLVYGNENEAGEMSICKLPSHIPLGSASVQVAMRPNSHDGSRSICTMTVNSNPARVYVSDERGAAQHLPLVVWKDVLALRMSSWSEHLISPNQEPSLQREDDRNCVPDEEGKL